MILKAHLTIKNKGFSLTEILLGVGLVSVLSLGGYILFGTNKSSAQAHAEQNRLNQLALAVESSYGATGGYSGITSSKVIQEKLIDNQWLHDGSLKAEWGPTISITPQTIARSNDGFMVSYPSTPSEVCAKLVPSMSTRAHKMIVNGTVIQEGDESRLNIGQMTSACSASPAVKVDFVFFTPSAAGLVASDPIELPPSSNTPPNIPNPSAPIKDPEAIVDGGNASNPGTVTPSPIPALPPAAIPPIPDSSPISGVVPPTASVPPIVTPPVITPPRACTPSESNENRASCPANQYGSTVWTTRQVCGDWNQPEAWATPTTQSFEVSRSCQNCPTGYQQDMGYQTLSSPTACPAGTTGTATQFTQQRGVRQVSYAYCPAGTTSAPPAQYGAVQWTNSSSWVDTSACVTDKPSVCIVETENSYGTVDGSDSFHSISYSINGEHTTCSASWRDTTDGGYCVSRTISSNQWIQMGMQGQLRQGDSYYVSGDTSWGTGRYPWSYSTLAYEVKASPGPGETCLSFN